MSSEPRSNAELVPIESLITSIRDRKVIVDSDLARIYGVTTARLNQQVKRNLERFPKDFMFRLTKSEFEGLILQSATSKTGRGGRRKLPYAFTEHGALMAANVLNSSRAVQMSVFVVRAFIKMREVLAANKTFAGKLLELEKKLAGRLDVHEKAILHVIREIKRLMEPAPAPAPQDRVSGEGKAGEVWAVKGEERPSSSSSLAPACGGEGRFLVSSPPWGEGQGEGANARDPGCHAHMVFGKMEVG